MIAFIYDHLKAPNDVEKEKTMCPQKILWLLDTYLMRGALLGRAMSEGSDLFIKKKAMLKSEL